MFPFFRRLQWKLTLSYAVVTSGTVIILVMLLIGFVLLTEMSHSNRTFSSFYWSKTAFQDNIPYLLDDPEAMEAWLSRVQTEGFDWNDIQSYTVRETLDYANAFRTGAPVYVLDPDLNLIAAIPPLDGDLAGAPFARAR